MNEIPTPAPSSADAAPRPAPDDGPALHWEALPPAARVAARVGALLAAVLTYSPPAALGLAVWDGGPATTRALLFVVGLGLAALLAWRVADARHRHTAFALDAGGLRIRRGIFWRSETLVPRSRVQHTDLNRGPLDRRFALATLKVYTAGTKLASVALDGLPATRAAQLRDALVGAEDDAV